MTLFCVDLREMNAFSSELSCMDPGFEVRRVLLKGNRELSIYEESVMPLIRILKNN